MPNENNCWQCHRVTPDEYSLTWGRRGYWEVIAYLCSRECLSEYISENWDDL